MVLAGSAWHTFTVRAPHGAGMEPIIAPLEELLADEIATAAQLAVCRGETLSLRTAMGRYDATPAAKPVTHDAPFLVASITKPMTATVLMQLVENGKLALNDPVVQYLPTFTGDGRDQITIWHLPNKLNPLQPRELRRGQCDYGR